MKTASKTFTKVTKVHGQSVVLEVEMKMEYLSGNKKPYFSITGNYYKANKKGERDKRYKDCIGGGACHDIILKAFPQFKDFVEFHLRDSDGAPMYPVENGFYFADTANIPALAHHLLVSVEEAQRIADTCKTKDEFWDMIAPMYQRWNEQAQSIMDKYDLCLPNSYLQSIAK